jgi:RecA/RadA recombinase
MTRNDPTISRLPDASFGIEGLDDVLSGGLTRNRVYLLEGSPGTGKTTAAMSYLQAGAALGEHLGDAAPHGAGAGDGGNEITAGGIEQCGLARKGRYFTAERWL